MGSLTPEVHLTTWFTQKPVLVLFISYSFTPFCPHHLLPFPSFHYFIMFIVVLSFVGALTHCVFLFGTYEFYIYINSSGLFLTIFTQMHSCCVHSLVCCFPHTDSSVLGPHPPPAPPPPQWWTPACLSPSPRRPHYKQHWDEYLCPWWASVRTSSASSPKTVELPGCEIRRWSS